LETVGLLLVLIAYLGLSLGYSYILRLPLVTYGLQVLQIRFNEALEGSRTLLQISIKVDLRMVFENLHKFWKRNLKLLWTFQIRYDLVDLSFKTTRYSNTLGSACGGTLTSTGSCAPKALKNSIDPLMDVEILLSMALYDGIRLPHTISFELDDFVEHGFDNLDSLLIVGGLALMVDDQEILVNGEEDLLNVKLINHLLDDLARLQQALHNQARQTRH
jgi:hypothetical protein